MHNVICTDSSLGTTSCAGQSCAHDHTTVCVLDRTGHDMAAPALPRIAIDADDGSTLAVATLDFLGPDVARVSLHVSPGHLPSGTRTRLVDAVFDDPDVRSRRRLQVTLPMGDIEILDRLRERGVLTAFRAAGSTSLVEADLPGV
jgi:FAD/FMN-containing dehydrogenase